MTKKFIGIAIVALLLFSVFGLAACNGVSLADYKETAKADITAHVDGLTQTDYTTENWVLIGQRANEGKAAVDAATDEAQVDTAKASAITAINGVSVKEEVTMQLLARQTYLEEILKGKNQAATIDDVSFFRNKFLGIYDGSLVGVFYGGQYHGNFPEVEESVEINDLTFAWSQGYPILVWNDGEIYGLAEAFEQNLLTTANIVTIHELYYSEV